MNNEKTKLDYNTYHAIRLLAVEEVRHFLHMMGHKESSTLLITTGFGRYEKVLNNSVEVKS